MVVSGGVDTAVGTVGNTFQIAGNSILSHVSETKQGLHNALENFDSQKLFNKGRVCERMCCNESQKIAYICSNTGIPRLVRFPNRTK